MSEKKSTYLLPVTLKQEFDSFCRANGYELQLAVRGAIRMFINGSPPDLRELAMHGMDEQVRHWFQTAIAAVAHEQVAPQFAQILQQLAEIRSGMHQKAGHGRAK